MLTSLGCFSTIFAALSPDKRPIWYGIVRQKNMPIRLTRMANPAGNRYPPAICRMVTGNTINMLFNAYIKTKIKAAKNGFFGVYSMMVSIENLFLIKIL